MANIKPIRYGGVIYVNEDKLEEYKKLHSAVWPDVLDRLTKSNIRNFTIYYCKQLSVLFSHMEYIGEDVEKDMAAIAADPKTKEWWRVSGQYLTFKIQQNFVANPQLRELDLLFRKFDFVIIVVEFEPCGIVLGVFHLLHFTKSVLSALWVLIYL